MKEKALAKLNEGRKGKLDKYGEVMKDAVADALITFAKQDEELAQAIVQGGSFADCMKAVSKEIRNNAISDMAAYGAAVRFFFPGAEIRVKMTIDLVGAAAEPAQEPEQTEEAPAETGGVIIDLSDFF